MIEIQKNAVETVRVEPTTYRERQYVNARVWVQNEAGDYVPTPKGLTLTPDLCRRVATAMLDTASTIDPDED